VAVAQVAAEGNSKFGCFGERDLLPSHDRREWSFGQDQILRREITNCRGTAANALGRRVNRETGDGEPQPDSGKRHRLSRAAEVSLGQSRLTWFAVRSPCANRPTLHGASMPWSQASGWNRETLYNSVRPCMRQRYEGFRHYLLIVSTCLRLPLDSGNLWWKITCSD